MIKMDENKFPFSENSEKYEDQIADVNAESTSSVPNVQGIHSIDRTPESLPRKTNINMAAVVGIIVVLALLIVVFFAPWYSASAEMSALGEKININANFYLTNVDANFPGMGNFQTGEVDYDEITDQEEGAKAEVILGIFNNTMYIVIGVLILTNNLQRLTGLFIK